MGRKSDKVEGGIQVYIQREEMGVFLGLVEWIRAKERGGDGERLAWSWVGRGSQAGALAGGHGGGPSSFFLSFFSFGVVCKGEGVKGKTKKEKERK